MPPCALQAWIRLIMLLDGGVLSWVSRTRPSWSILLTVICCSICLSERTLEGSCSRVHKRHNSTREFHVCGAVGGARVRARCAAAPLASAVSALTSRLPRSRHASLCPIHHSLKHARYSVTPGDPNPTSRFCQSPYISPPDGDDATLPRTRGAVPRPQHTPPPTHPSPTTTTATHPPYSSLCPSPLAQRRGGAALAARRVELVEE